MTASSVSADGSTSSLEGEATTETDGTFTLEAVGEGARGMVHLDADGSSDYSSSTLVMVDGRSEVEAQPLTAETKAEAAAKALVYLSAFGNGSA